MKRRVKLTSPSPPRLPKIGAPVPEGARPEGGRPPLADGCGMGEGDFAGAVTLGLLGIAMGAEAADCEI